MVSIEESFIHMVYDVKVEKGLRLVKVACGAHVVPDKITERQTDWSVWTTEVTCVDCRLVLACGQ